MYESNRAATTGRGWPAPPGLSFTRSHDFWCGCHETLILPLQGRMKWECLPWATQQPGRFLAGTGRNKNFNEKSYNG
jgi:hypothetical protein